MTSEARLVAFRLKGAVIPIFLILLVFQTREYRYGDAQGWRRPVYAVLVGADIIFAGAAEIVAMFALFRSRIEPGTETLSSLLLPD